MDYFTTGFLHVDNSVQNVYAGVCVVYFPTTNCSLLVHSKIFMTETLHFYFSNISSDKCCDLTIIRFYLGSMTDRTTT